MLPNVHPKVLGAILIGGGLVAGAYTYSNFGESRFPTPANTVAAVAAPRVAIAVTDTDNNGIEDWRDQFVTTEPIRVDAATSTYTPPETLTGQVGISLFENIIRARNGGPFSPTQDEVINETVDTLAAETALTLYTAADVTVLETWTDQDIKNYGNAMAGALIRNNIEGLDSELTILNEALNRNQPERLSELATIASVYERTRDDSVLVPVPQIFLKQHLDLINTYHALHNTISALAKGLDDPAMALLHIKRYEDDALGLSVALENMALTLSAYPQLFTAADQATLFSSFNPNQQAN